MPALHVESGWLEGQVHRLDRERTLLGRNHDCHIVIPHAAVSRWHAEIVQGADGYTIADLDSRNGTLVNEVRITQRQPLRPGDRVRIGDFRALFLTDEAAFTTSTLFETALPAAAALGLEAQPAARLAALLGITAKLSQTLRLEALLPEVAQGLLELFRQAERCLLILVDGADHQLRLRLIKTRRPEQAAGNGFSRSIVHRCLNDGRALLLEEGDGASATQSMADCRLRSVMCVPLSTADGRRFGVIQIDTQDRNRRFNEADLRFLSAVAQLAAVSLENAHFYEERLHQVRLQRDLELAREVQRSLLPPALPTPPGYEFFATYEPARAVGGDYYDFLPLPERRLAITVGDVVGKGVPAALLMARFSAEARTCLLTHRSLPRALKRLNVQLASYAEATEKYVTLALAVLDPAAHTVTLISAGHPPPLLYRHARRRVRSALPRDHIGFPIGMMRQADYTARHMKLGPGDSLWLFSDGITDALDREGTPFGVERLRSLLVPDEDQSPRTVGERLLHHVHTFAAAVPPFDDMTLVGFGRRL